MTTSPWASTAPAALSASRVAFRSRSERSLHSWRTASMSTSRMAIAGDAITSPAASEPIEASIRAAASSMGISTWYVTTSSMPSCNESTWAASAFVRACSTSRTTS